MATLKLSNSLFVLGQESHGKGRTKLVCKSQAYNYAGFMRRMWIIIFICYNQRERGMTIYSYNYNAAIFIAWLDTTGGCNKEAEARGDHIPSTTW